MMAGKCWAWNLVGALAEATIFVRDGTEADRARVPSCMVDPFSGWVLLDGIILRLILSRPQPDYRATL